MRQSWFSQIKEEILWHYTSIDVLFEFTKPDGYIFASHSSELNDSKELQYGRDIWDSIIKEKKLDNREQIAKDYISTSPCMKHFGDNSFIFSLSKNKDRVCHWKTYIPNGGIAIGFNISKLKESLNEFIDKFTQDSPEYSVTGICKAPIPRQAHFDYCCYGRDSVRSIFTNFIDKMPQYLDKNDVVLSTLQQFYYREALIPFAKHESFCDENEVRIFYSAHDLLEQSEWIAGKRRIKLVPSANLIDTVLISPHGNINAYRCYANFLKEQFSLNYSVEDSQSTYRG